MPRFGAQDTTVQLSVADLKRATTQNARAKHCPESIQNIAHEFARGSKDGTLTETALKDKNERDVRFLGKHETIPFFMVHAGENFFHASTKEKRNRRPARVPSAGIVEGESASTDADLEGQRKGIGTTKDANVERNPKYKPPFVRHALCLSVFLSPKSFQINEIARTGIHDLKIDVYFNGALCGSHYVSQRYCGERYNMTEHIVRFTGRRIGRSIEKPWIIVPSGQNPNGSLREYRRGRVTYAGAQQRWTEISDALMAEADKTGRNEKGDRSVIGEYLESLAQLSMPKEVEDMQRAGSAKFGVLDAVVSYGKGNKDSSNTPYLLKPTPIRIEGFININPDQPMDHSSVQNVTITSDSTHTAPRSRSEALAIAKSTDDDSDTSPQSVTPLPGPTPNHQTNSAASSSSRKRPSLALPLERPVKRARSRYYDTVTTKQTLEEDYASITRNIQLSFQADQQAKHASTSHASTADSSPLSSAPMTGDHTPALTNIVKPKLPSPANRTASPSMTNISSTRGGNVDSGLPAKNKERTPAPNPKRKERAPSQLKAEALDHVFVTPALSVDCSITYAASGTLRNVGAVRGGVFKEGGVLFGARFVVGG